MNTAAGTKRKRATGKHDKTFSKNRKIKRAAAYHSSSDEAEEEAELHGTGIPDADEELIGSEALDLGNRSGVLLPNLLDGSVDAGQEIDAPESADTLAQAEAEHSYSEDDDVGDSAEDSELATQSSASDDEDQDVSRDDTTNLARKPRKRNDPSQFATSISKILSSKLTKDKRSDPVLSRSKDAADTSKEVAEDRLEAKARRKLRDDRKSALIKGRETDVLGLNRQGVSAGTVIEEERQLKKTAQRGVVKLFNAVRASQVQGEDAARDVKGRGVVGADKRQEQVNEMSKKGFLDLLVGDA